MSGPKKADVQAELRHAAAASRKSAELISAQETAAVQSQLNRVDRVLASAGQAARGLDGAARDLASIPEATSAAAQAKASVAGAGDAMTRATRARTAAARALAEAAKLDGQAAAAFEAGRKEYERAEAAVTRAGLHYLHDEMKWARSARASFEQAAAVGASAARARASARKAATAAVAAASEAAAAVDSALDRTSSAKAEAQERARAEAEARRIAAEALRSATVAVGAARSAVGGLDSQACRKFAPGELEKLATAVAAGERVLASDPAGAERAVSAIPEAARRLAEAVAEAKAQWERKRAAAEAALADLESSIEGCDAEVIAKWAPDPGALDGARAAARDAAAQMRAEDFGAAGASAAAAGARLAAAQVAAAENLGAHDRRTSIGEAVMDVLEDLGFDVSVEEGTRDDPMRIAGQTADADGRGDFDIEIPLDGEIDFEVTAKQGDGSCAAAVAGLQKRLAERGVTWRTTDWGYGHEPSETVGRASVRTRTEERTHTRSR